MSHKPSIHFFLNMKIRSAELIFIVIIAAVLRVLYAMNNPLSGDEIGVNVLTASGQATGYLERLPKGIVPIKQIKDFVSYSKDFYVKDVLSSLKYAGPHPPLYYLILHYVLKYAGNGYFVLRLLSIFISLLSVIFIYQLGKIVSSEKVGLYAALFLAVSAYGVRYGAMVTRYPLAMLISIISTFQAYELNRNNDSFFKNRKLLLYIITSLAGFYTVYHFAFVFIFQIAFLIMSNLRDKKKLVKIISMVATVSVLYLPWAPFIFNQYQLVLESGKCYFQGKANPLAFIQYFYFNFMLYLSFLPVQFVIAIKALISIISLVGVYHLSKEKRGLLFILTFAFYFFIYYAFDTLLNMHSLSLEKLYFFIMPILFVLLSLGIDYLTPRYFIKKIFLLFCCGALIWNSLAVCYFKPGFDGPPEVKTFRDKIQEYLAGKQKGLIIINTAQRRYLFPSAHAINNHVDMKVMLTDKIENEIPNPSNIGAYDFVFVMNWLVDNNANSNLSYQDIKYILDYCIKYGFVLAYPSRYEPFRSSLYIFKKIK